jgi:hypothetical protein
VENWGLHEVQGTTSNRHNIKKAFELPPLLSSGKLGLHEMQGTTSNRHNIKKAFELPLLLSSGKLGPARNARDNKQQTQHQKSL